MGQAELSYGDVKITLPVVEGTEGEKAVDISKLRATTGLVTMDNGYVNTGCCESEITFINGEAGILRYRGYPIEEISRVTNFLETAYLVIYGSLPTQAQYDDFRARIVERYQLAEGIGALLRTFPSEAHPMGCVMAAVSGLFGFYPYDTSSPEETEIAIARLLGKLPAIAAACYRNRQGLPLLASDKSMTYAGNFLHLMFGGGDYEVDEDVAEALDMLLILHADHEQNCSTATVRIAGSSQVNVSAAVAAGMASLWGPLHGGANQAVIEMLTRIHQDGGNVEKYVALAKDKSSEFRLMGFGHRVYKNFDPRAAIIKKYCDRVLAKLGIVDPLLELAVKLEETALKDDYFIERKLFPNVDFYSGIIYKAIGIPTDMFTVMFAIGRLPGWLAQWSELKRDPKFRIGRPRQIYQGPTQRKVASQVTNHY